MGARPLVLFFIVKEADEAIYISLYHQTLHMVRLLSDIFEPITKKAAQKS